MLPATFSDNVQLLQRQRLRRLQGMHCGRSRPVSLIAERPVVDDRRSVLSLSEGDSSSSTAGTKRESLANIYNDSIDKDKAREGSADGGSQQSLESTVYVFGYPPESQDAVLAHFKKYGEIVEHEKTGNWLALRYATTEAATKALGSNSKAIVGNSIVGVARAGVEKEPSPANVKPQKSLRVIPFNQAQNIFKKPEDKKPRQGPSDTMMGTGKVGLSVLSCPSVSAAADVALIQDATIKNTIKDILFEW
ncbi:hypothetical protein BX666DRAFT_1481030 [Dichotomocladium elegans]|nr:hypothetical protein BX666DRAFT_1481030 [Dichotomocladium elegans]